MQGERDELEAAVFEAHEVIAANAADSADEGSDGDDGASSGEARRLVAERRRLQASALLKVSLAERDALNAELLRKKAEQDAELGRALEMNLKLVPHGGVGTRMLHCRPRQQGEAVRHCYEMSERCHGLPNLHRQHSVLVTAVTGDEPVTGRQEPRY